MLQTWERYLAVVCQHITVLYHIALMLLVFMGLGDPDSKAYQSQRTMAWSKAVLPVFLFIMLIVTMAYGCV